MIERECKHCGETFSERHGNAAYCSKACYMEAKKGRNRILYSQRKRYDPILKNDQILAWFDQKGHTVVPIGTLVQRGFDDRYYLKLTKMDHTTVAQTGQFGFSSYSNNEFKIHQFDD